MIKLNNKNITYVALADTNNSLKAPKEVWYADSNNSVKLVYRRKDALIEGEDYEKYHWVKGDKSAYIDTNIVVDVPSLHISTSFTKKEGNSTPLFGSRDTINRNGSQIWYQSDGHLRLDIITKGTDSIIVDSSNVQNINQLIVDCPNKVVSVNEITLPSGEDDLSIKNSIYTFKIFSLELLNVYGTNGNTPYHGAFSNFTLNDSTHSFNLIPCKLLKPVPKWLDANGIRRQVGECGMIDLVSGKFYGNVNSVGTFTVENYYERKEWLQGRNGAYINTMHSLTTYDDAFYVKAHFDGTIKNPNNWEQNIFGYTHLNNDTITDICRLYINSSGRISCNYYIPDGNWTPLPDSLGLTDIEVYSYAVGNNHYVNLNDTLRTLSTNGMQQQTFGSFIALFSINGDDDNEARLKSRYFHGDIASFRISDPTFTTDKMNLIPCTLTMDLPASMDANNIARTKGTSGMWDLVSDRFYGNVANSGTFKAVNLAEGVDYEVHDWLVGDGSAYIDTNVPLKNISNYSIKIYIIDSNHSVGIFGARISAYDDVNLEVILYWTTNSLSFGMDFGNYEQNRQSQVIQSNNQYEIEWYNGELSINNENIATIQYTTSSEMTAKLFASQNYVSANDIHIFQGKIGSLVISDVIDLVPVKLLRSIPAKYDANGIARQAGECGMYDTVNDVFYGNVASSGTFSVSDDS